MAIVEIRVPDIGDFKDVPVIEIHVAPGDTVNPEDPLITLESDKASLEVPAPQAGTVVELKLAQGDLVSQGSVIMTLEAAGAAATPPKERVSQNAAPAAPGGPASYGSASGVYETIDVEVPDIGDFADVEVIEVHVTAGSSVRAEDPLLTLESDKASMDTPSPAAGTIAEVLVKPGDRVSKGTRILKLRSAASGNGASIAMPPAASAARPPVATPGDLMPRYWCWEPVRAATPRHSVPPILASRSCWWSAGVARWRLPQCRLPRRCCMPPRWSPRARRWARTA